jgi:hypothetical protein
MYAVIAALSCELGSEVTAVNLADLAHAMKHIEAMTWHVGNMTESCSTMCPLSHLALLCGLVVVKMTIAIARGLST